MGNFPATGRRRGSDGSVQSPDAALGANVHATRIQAQLRVRFARKKIAEMKRRRRNGSATLIQALCRSKVARKNFAEMKRINSAATRIQAKFRSKIARNISEIVQQLTFINKEAVHFNSLTDKQKEIFIWSLEYAYKRKYNLIQGNLLSLITNDRIRKRIAENPQEASARDKACQKMANASQKRVKWAREIKTLSYMARVFDSKELDVFLRNYHLNLVFGVASFILYFIRFLANVIDILKTCLSQRKESKAILSDQWARKGTNILNDAVWSIINGFDFILFIGQVPLSAFVASIVLPVINLVGYAFDLWNEKNDMKKTINNYAKILRCVGGSEEGRASGEGFKKDMLASIEKDRAEKINKHRLSIVIAANLFLFNFVASIFVISIIANPSCLAAAFTVVALCALATVFCSRIKARYKKSEVFRGEIDEKIGVRLEKYALHKLLLLSFICGCALSKLYYLDFKERVKNKFCCNFRDNGQELEGGQAAAVPA